MDKAKIQIILAIITGLVVCSHKPAQAASIAWTGSASTTWTIGTVSAGTTWTSTGSPNSWTVRNDMTSGYENITITVASTGSWVAGCDQYGNPTNAGANVYILKDNQLRGVCPTAITTFISKLNAGASSGFGLLFTAPTSGEDKIEHTLTVTLTAVAVPCEAGSYSYAGACWVKGVSGASCTTTCGSRGNCIATTYLTATQAAVCTGLSPSIPQQTQASCATNPLGMPTSTSTTCYLASTDWCGCSATSLADYLRLCPCGW